MFIAGIFDAPDGKPDSWYQPALLPFALLLFGALIFAGGVLQDQRNMTKTPARWVGFGLICLATFLGFTKTMYTMDPMYKALITEYPKRWLWMHYGAFLVPLLSAAAALGWNWWEKKQKEFLS
ncbi:MAG: hypothetical protein ABL949_03420 [Fimbriimonadaceae bacterium]